MTDGVGGFSLSVIVEWVVCFFGTTDIYGNGLCVSQDRDPDFESSELVAES